MQEFIKVIDPEMAKRLIEMGFSYVREQDYYAFCVNNELISVLHECFSEQKDKYVVEHKLKF